jgi:hypothetical protein
MKRWQLETLKMSLCVAFPVFCFYVFNKPEIFKESLIKDRLENFPPVDKESVRSNELRREREREK